MDLPNCNECVLAPTNAEMLDALRMALSRQVDRRDHPEVFTLLLRRGFIEWTRRKQVKANFPDSWRTTEIAIISPDGYAALDWLASVAHSPQWTLRGPASYGS